MHFLDEGQGAPVLMLHGNPTWSFHYRTLVKALSGTVRCIVPDHLGMGLSEKPPEDAYGYRLLQRVEDVEALLKHLNIGQGLTVIAHDWGGMIGLSLMERNPTLVSRLVLMNTAGFGLPPGRALPWQIFLARTMPSKFLVRRLNLFVEGAILGCSKRPGGLSLEARAGYRLPYNSPSSRIGVHKFVLDIPLLPGDPSFPLLDAVAQKLPELTRIPSLLLWGEQDFVFDRHFLAEWRRRVPELAIKTFPKAGHFLLEDEPNAVLHEISSFLSLNPL